jgi:tetratricopeptide (TPR) repeat protein
METQKSYSRGAAFGWCLSIALVAILQIASEPALSQGGGGFDYYAPRVKGEDITRLKNVEDYHLGPGQQKVAKQQYLYAMQEFAFILGYYPNHPKALSLLSNLCQKWQDRKCDAEGAFERAIKRNPNAAPTYLLYGVHLHRKRKMEEAVKAYRRAVELAPNSLDAHYNLGLAYAELKQYDLANQHAQRSYQLGAFTPGLRTKLQKAGKWNPNVSLPDTQPPTAAGGEEKTR